MSGKLASGFMKSGHDAKIPTGLNPQGKAHWVFDQFSIFPNQLFIIGDGWYTHHEFWPVAVDQTLWSASYFVPPTDSALLELVNEFYKVRVRDTVLEDLDCIEGVHASHRSGAIDEMVLSGQEAQILRHRTVLSEYIQRFAEITP